MKRRTLRCHPDAMTRGRACENKHRKRLKHPRLLAQAAQGPPHAGCHFPCACITRCVDGFATDMHLEAFPRHVALQTQATIRYPMYTTSFAMRCARVHTCLCADTRTTCTLRSGNGENLLVVYGRMQSRVAVSQCRRTHTIQAMSVPISQPLKLLNPQPSTLNPQPSTVTRNPKPETRNPKPETLHSPSTTGPSLQFISTKCNQDTILRP
jgi:hypothetical protein